ncbi:hypothetical protein PGIN_7BTORR_00190 [Porphyromonas gingivalis]|uniref:hypothetical protein n=1 Tax=Porphyromonas gingivalis TaxID=837 RepID=UPI000974F7A2|nr:hypothetical protein [Porphyromonas gingivalis]QUI90308.1 hypothetical protein KDH82_03955 [Porphyromonas gingivalis]QUI92254.1 hypothetical protein KC155_03945 [Porphyromonas gingivalis]SJL21957.1 hypothetical protein PGIN_7BTORR_00190 [Porphyromonas gingivalis]
MKKGDLLILLIIILMLGLMLSPWTSETFNSLSLHYPYYIGFLKFAILATIGEVLAGRIKAQRYTCPTYLWVRIVIWGIVGILIVFNFGLYEAGIRGIIARGLLPDIDSSVYTAFLISSAMNLTFGPAFMAAHRISDTYLENKATGRGGSIRLAVERVDWNRFMTFVVGKTIPFFWIPAHTVTFLLPPEYRVFVAALLSIALGLILALASSRHAKA